MNATLLARASGLLLISALGCAAANPTSATTATSQNKDMFAALAETKITLDDAIQTAEHTVTGKLLKATLDGDNTSIFYKIAIADSNTRTVTALTIDTVTGKVLDSKTFHADKQTEKTSHKPGAAKTAPQTTSSKQTSTISPTVTPTSTPPATPSTSAAKP